MLLFKPLCSFRLACVKPWLLKNQVYLSRKSDIRPTVDDVERISRGQAAKRRGTGSRAVPHRLNEAERKEWELAKRRRFLMLRGTGWRKERGDSPLANIYRNYCDAVAVPCISITRAIGINENVDHVIVDFSPLRTTDIRTVAQECLDLAKSFPSAIHMNDYSDASSLGWESLNQLLVAEPIWRIPVFSITVGFNQRSDAKRYAEQLATQYANGQSYSQRDDNINDMEIKDDIDDFIQT
jgi:hypothetical protein